VSATVDEAVAVVSEARRVVPSTMAATGIGHSFIARITMRSNKESKLTKPYTIGASQLNSSVGQT
jgi:hypothetical protein